MKELRNKRLKEHFGKDGPKIAKALYHYLISDILPRYEGGVVRYQPYIHLWVPDFEICGSKRWNYEYTASDFSISLSLFTEFNRLEFRKEFTSLIEISKFFICTRTRDNTFHYEAMLKDLTTGVMYSTKF